MTTRARIASWIVVVSVLASPVSSHADELLPQATLKMMQDKKLDLKLLDGVDRELQMPQAWVDGARKEGLLRVNGTWDPPQFEIFIRPFRERYPYIRLRYARGSRFDRVVKPLVAFKSGRSVVDVITGVADEYTIFRDAGALVNLSVVPNSRNVPPGMQQKDGWWVGQRLRYWCMSYNTEKISRDQLPKTWDDLVTSPVMKNGNIGMGNRPNLWLLPMWETKGEPWIKNFVQQLFAVDKPQLRNEGMNALLELAVAGEFSVSLPSAEYRTKLLEDKGAPISWHCPEPVPLTISEITVMKGGNVNAALMFINWFLSKEGQISQYVADLAPPVHKDLQTREFLSYPDEVLGRKTTFLDPDFLERDIDSMAKIWDPLWYGGKGLKVQVVKVDLTKVEKGGRSIGFSVNGVPHTAKVDQDNTRISIKGSFAEAVELQAGQACEITYAGNNQDAIRIDCQ